LQEPQEEVLAMSHGLTRPQPLSRKFERYAAALAAKRAPPAGFGLLYIQFD